MADEAVEELLLATEWIEEELVFDVHTGIDGWLIVGTLATEELAGHAGVDGMGMPDMWLLIVVVVPP